MRCAIVTGAAQGLGRAVALRLLQDGMNVVAADVQGEKLATVGALLEKQADRFHPVPVDLGKPQGAADLVDAALVWGGRVDVLVNAAGGSGHTAAREIEDTTDTLWSSVIDSNLNATFYTCRSVSGTMRKAGYGRIINFSSTLVDGSTMWPSTVGARLAYCAAKGGIEAFSRQLALDLAPCGITVNVIVPGFILTEPGARVRERFQALSAEDRQRLLGGRSGDELAGPDDIAEAVAFLASERSGHVNGALLRIGA